MKTFEDCSEKELKSDKVRANNQPMFKVEDNVNVIDSNSNVNES